MIHLFESKQNFSRQAKGIYLSCPADRQNCGTAAIPTHFFLFLTYNTNHINYAFALPDIKHHVIQTVLS